MVEFKLYFNKDKETEYLNEMAQKGYAMTGFMAGFYTFDRCQPGEYIYQVDISEGMFRVSNDYREFMQEMGVEIVCQWGLWVILRKKAADGPFLLYTDVESSIEHYEKIKRMFKIAMFLEIILIIVEVLCAANGKDRASITLPLVFSSLLTVIVVVLGREIVRVEGILEELRERIGMEGPSKWGRRDHRPSRLMCIGLILNVIGFLIPKTGGMLYGILNGALHGLALVLIGVGVAVTLWGRKE